MKFTTVSPQTRIAFETKMAEVLEICRQKSGKDIPSIPLKFSQMGTRAGVCHCRWTVNSSFNLGVITSSTLKQSECYIVINPDYLVKHWDDMLNDTCPHEMAHYIAAFLFGKEAYNHGYLWKRVMSWMGINGAERCHTYSTEGVKMRKTNRDYKYSCSCPDGHMLTRKKHESHQWSLSNGRKGLYCTRCKKYLTYQGFNMNGIFVPYKKPETAPVKVMEVIKITPIATFVHNVNPPAPAAPSFKTVTKFVDGMLVNVRVPVGA